MGAISSWPAQVAGVVDIAESLAPRAWASPEQRVVSSAPVAVGSPHLPTCPKQLYFDMEGDPERGFCYLVGVIGLRH